MCRLYIIGREERYAYEHSEIYTKVSGSHYTIARSLPMNMEIRRSSRSIFWLHSCGRRMD